MSKIKLPKEFRTKWLKALTNGSYRQTSSALVDKREGRKNEYCCLGVACRIKGIPVKDLESHGMPSSINIKKRKILPAAFFAKGIKERKVDSNFAKRLANLNDKGMSFKEIAKYIKTRTVAA